MADNVVANSGSGGATFRTDDDGTAHWPYTKMAWGADNTQTILQDSGGSRLPVNVSALGDSSMVATDGSAALTIGLHALGTDGTNAQILSTNTSGHVNIADGGNSITVDGTLTTVTTVSTVTNLAQLGGTAISMNTGTRDAGTQRVTIATDDVVPISDNSGSITVDAPLATPVNVQIGDGTTSAGVYTEDAAGGGGETGSFLIGRRQDSDTSPVSADGDYHGLIFDEFGSVKVSPENLISADGDGAGAGGNSNTANTLAGGTTWTGLWEDVHRFALITVMIDTDTTSKTGTLKLQFSMDGSSVDRSIDLASIDPATESPHTLCPVAQYFRVEYVADGTSPADDLTNFQLQTLYHGAKSKGLTSRVDQTIGDTTDVDNVRAVIAGKTGGGSYVNVGVTTGGGIKVDAEELAGNPVSVNTGNADTGTQRVVLASDQPVVSTDWNGTAPPIGAGTEAAALRVTVATDSTGVLTVDGSELTTIAGAVSGTEMQVDVVAPLPAGTNAIGKLAANSGVDIGDVDVLSQPARDRLTDNMGVALQTDAILSDTTSLTPQFATIDAASSGDNQLVAAGTNKIRVLALMMVAAGDVNVRFESGAGGTALSGQMNLTTNSGFTLPFNPLGWFETASATALNLELSAATSVDGMLVYVDVA